MPTNNDLRILKDIPLAWNIGFRLLELAFLFIPAEYEPTIESWELGDDGSTRQ